MSFVWAGLMMLSFVFSAFYGTVQEVSDAVMTGAKSAVELVFSILGILCFWSGMMEIGKHAGICDGIGRLFSPLLRFLFRGVDKDSLAMKYISLNISANLLGLGNAATPFGLMAMQELQKVNPHKDRASPDMVLFVVMNTASLQLFPTTLGAYRASFGSAEPFGILKEIWITSLAALCVGITAAKCCRCGEKEDRAPLEICRRRQEAWR